MSSEILSANTEQANPVVMLQDRLGIDEDQARDLALIRVVCPVPGEDRQESLGDFMASEHGANKATTILDIAKSVVEKGGTPEEAISAALGFAALRDKDTGKLVRVTINEERATQADQSEPKKKLN
jgi:hypothetical protein